MARRERRGEWTRSREAPSRMASVLSARVPNSESGRGESLPEGRLRRESLLVIMDLLDRATSMGLLGKRWMSSGRRSRIS